MVDNGNNTGPWINPDYRGATYHRGYRQYELSNHLGNVLTTISDRKIGVYSGSSLNLPGGYTVPIVDYYNPDMVSATDYYPFGMVSRGVGPSDKYRFGFNGKENDNEVKGFGNQQDYGMRVYDPRIGRFLSVDPLGPNYPWYTPYQFAGNKPIRFIDLDGLEEANPSFWRKAFNYINGDIQKNRLDEYLTKNSLTSDNVVEFPNETYVVIKMTEKCGNRAHILFDI